MNTQANDDNKDEAKIKVEDLPLEKEQGEAVKGGPVYMKLGDIKGEVRHGGG